MQLTTKTGLAAALLAFSAGVSPASAADLGGSIKDGYVAPPHLGAPVGSCYFRSDVGYSFSGTPDVDWPVTDNNGNLITDDVTNVDIDNTWFTESGLGCGSGSRGFRGEVMLGFHGERDIDGEPGPWNPGPPVTADPLHTSVKSYTAMVNGYKDLGNFGGFTPYLGAGVGVAYNILEDVSFTGNPNLVNQIRGDRDLAFAWSLMAGVGFQISERTILDVGYRYIDMGKAESQNIDSAGFFNPRVDVDDIDAHEIKVGLRYHFGASDCCAYQPMK